MNEDRTGLEENHLEVLGMQVPLIEIPVRPWAGYGATR